MAILEERAMDVEEEELTGYGAEGDEDEEYGEEGEEAEYGDYGDYGEEEAVEEFPPRDKVPHIAVEDRFFMGNEKLRTKYSEVEIGAFMKILNVKPLRQWQDESHYHNKLGQHRYEDDS